MEFDELNNEITKASMTLPKHKLKRLKSVLHKGYCRRFKRSRIPKYGNINTVFKDDELQALFQNIKNEKFRLLFKFQASLGLRIGEVCIINKADINFDTREIKIHSEKTNTTDMLMMPSHLSAELASYITKHATAITNAGGYIFYKDPKAHKHNGYHYLAKDYARRIFREARSTAGLDDVYAFYEERYPGRATRKLYRLGTHSLRKYAGTRFHKHTKDLVLTSRFLRHQSPNETLRYIENDREQLYNNIESAFKVDIKQKQLMILKNT